MSTPIEDYALLGDTETAALVSSDGSIDWLGLPRFDSASCFGALLGERRHGYWKIAPATDNWTSTRSYCGNTLVLETIFTTETGSVKVIDFMPPRGNLPDLVRIVEGVSGTVKMHMDLVVRFDYGVTVPWARRINDDLHYFAGPDALVLHSTVPTEGRRLTTVADFTVSAGQREELVITWYPSHETAPGAIDVAQATRDTFEYWEEWASRCTYTGLYRDEVMRSLLTLKGLTYAPTGGIVAAATTSLPEQLGGERNWDYRYCWLRDATFTLFALLSNGFDDEAEHWVNWLLRAVAGRAEQMQIMYGVGGERRLVEYELEHLPGYEKSKPVRVGNAAASQFQLDVYGEVMDSLHLTRKAGIKILPTAWSVQRGLLKFVERHWRDPDEGIWEVRGEKQHFVHSKVMAWVAFDRGIKAVERYGMKGPVDHWRAIREDIRTDIMEKGWSEERQSFTQFYGSAELDAAVLMIPLVGFLPATDPKMRATVKAIKEGLREDGFVARYATHHARDNLDGLEGHEGAFLPCTFWLVDNLALSGEIDEAREIFEQLLKLANDVGLLAEEYDAENKRQLGNFPQAFTHVALVNSAMNLNRVLQ